ncbi:MAG TPA: MFS transporter [Usitatibacteraceae bacterium]|jgi:MFS family permease|nr:MFS transporter [Usitatibacteraceae bacterium]HRA24062.1 MFS transporter [Usitatibacteraceae bacterium]
MRRFASQYRDFFRLPDVAALVTVALLSRMPIGMVGLAMLLFLRESLGSYALAGTVSGVYFTAMAIAAPVQGRLIDRSGPRLTVAVTGVAHPIALGAVLAGALAGLGLGAVACAAAVAGAFCPPITTLTRTMWRHRFTRDEDRRRAFAIDAVLIEVNFTLGPAIVAGVVAAASARAAFALAIAVTVVALALFAASPALRYFRTGKHGERHLLGPLTQPRLLAVFAATFGLTTSFGFLEVGYPGFATAIALPALGGLFLSVNSLGSAIGGAIFGGLAIRAPIERQFAVATGTMAVPLLLHGFVDAPVAFALVAFLAGASIAPSIACQSVLVSRLAPAQYATEAFTWSSSFILLGLGAGIALGGWLIEASGPKSPFLAGAFLMAVVSLGVLALPVARAGPRESAAGR